MVAISLGSSPARLQRVWIEVAPIGSPVIAGVTCSLKKAPEIGGEF